MNRDAILATFIGLVLGLTITGLVIVGPQLFKTLGKLRFPSVIRQHQAITTNQPTPTPSMAPLTIAAPLPEAIEYDNHLVISGIAKPQATIVVNSPTDDDVTTAGADGQYAAKVTLTEGKNDITVTSYDAQQKTFVQTTTVYYAPENF